MIRYVIPDYIRHPGLELRQRILKICYLAEMQERKAKTLARQQILRKIILTNI